MNWTKDRVKWLRSPQKTVIRPKIAAETNSIVSSTEKEYPFDGEVQGESVENAIAFVSPIPIFSTIHSGSNSFRCIRNESLLYMNLKNNSSGKNSVLIPKGEASGLQQQYQSTIHNVEKPETGCPSALENQRLVSGAYIKDLLWVEGGEAESDSAIPFYSDSPKKIQDSSDSSTAELPQPYFLPTAVQESRYGLSSSSSQLQATTTICRNEMLPDTTSLRKSMEKMRFRARDPRLGPTIPLNHAEERKAQELFTMDVEDSMGQTAFAWCNWIANNVATRTCIAKSIRDAIIRFTLPANLQELENLDVVQYLQDFCFIDNERMVLYEALYSKERQVEFSLASLRETALRLIPKHFGNEVDELISFLDLPGSSSVGQDVFCKFLGLCERLLTQVVGAAGDSGSGLSSDESDKWRLQADPLERLDFRYLNERLIGINVKPLLKTLLERLAMRTATQFLDFPVAYLPESKNKTKPESRREFENALRSQLTQKETTTFKFTHH